MSDKKVVIIGAGCAGLSAAHTLKKKGIDFVLLDDRDSYGGRSRSYYFDPEHPDYYYTRAAIWTEPTEEVSQELLEEFDLMPLYREFDRLLFGFYFNDKVHPIDMSGNVFEIMTGLKDIPKSIIPQGLKFLKNFTKVKPLLDRREGDGVYGMDELAQTVAGKSVEEWTLENAGPEVLDKLIAPMANGICVGTEDKISVVQPLYILARIGGVGQIKGGHYGSINKAIYDEVEDDVRFNSRVEEIVIEDGKVQGVKLADGDFIEADQVICCAEADNALKMLPNAPEIVKDALAREEYSMAFDCIMTKPERRDPKDMQIVMISPSTESKLSIMFEENAQDLCAAPGSSLMHVYTSPKYYDEFKAMSEEERFLAMRAEAAKILPDLADAEYLASFEYAMGDAAHGMGYQGNDSFNALLNMENQYHDEVQGLHLGGAYRVMHCSTEGAYTSGKIEAEAVAAELAA